MVIVMDMDTGKFERLDPDAAAVEEFGPFVDEVLNAGGLPQPEACLETHEHARAAATQSVDADEFLRTLYRSQE